MKINEVKSQNYIIMTEEQIKNIPFSNELLEYLQSYKENNSNKYKFPKDDKNIKEMFKKISKYLENNDITLLHYALIERNSELFKYLIKECEINNINVKDKNNRTLLHYAIKEKEDEKGVKTSAVKLVYEKVELVRYLVEDLKLNLNLQDKDGNTPIFYIMGEENVGLAIYLIEHGANIKAIQNNNGIYPLHIAANNGNTALIKYSVERYGVDILNLKDKDNMTLLHYLATSTKKTAISRTNLVELFQDLLEKYKIDINIKDKNGMTPLHYAVMAGNKELVTCLIEHGADPEIKNKYGKKALELPEKSIEQADYNTTSVENKKSTKVKNNKDTKINKISIKNKEKKTNIETKIFLEEESNKLENTVKEIEEQLLSTKDKKEGINYSK